MLFNSFVFLLAFLPLSLALHWGAERYAPAWRLPVLVVLSFAFYGWWDWRFLPLLALSIGLNWLIAEAFHKTKAGALITLAIIANLAVLALFKYFNFFADLAGMIPGLPAPGPAADPSDT